MTGTALERPIAATAWELRSAWATGRRVSITLDQRANTPRLEGHISAVAATDAYIVIDRCHVPLDAVLAVHRPSRLGDSSIADGQRWAGPRRAVVAQREALFA